MGVLGAGGNVGGGRLVLEAAVAAGVAVVALGVLVVEAMPEQFRAFGYCVWRMGDIGSGP